MYACRSGAAASRHLDAWLAWAGRSKVRPFVKLAQTLRHYRAGVVAAVDLCVSNGRLEDHLNTLGSDFDCLGSVRHLVCCSMPDTVSVDALITLIRQFVDPRKRYNLRPDLRPPDAVLRERRSVSALVRRVPEQEIERVAEELAQPVSRPIDFGDGTSAPTTYVSCLITKGGLSRPLPAPTAVQRPMPSSTRL